MPRLTPIERGPREPAPDRIGRYRLCYQIARGGMGTVYLARADAAGGFSKLFALKCIHPHLADDERVVTMFMDEARVMSRVEHRNVCPVFDFGEADGVHFIAMPFLQGETLNAAIHAAHKEDELAEGFVATLAWVVAEAARGLHAAHEARDDAGRPLNLVHRDVSPHNIMICYDGEVRVLDFGVAAAAGRATQTRTGVLKGKLAYMSPEQVKREPPDRRLDVFALGIILWEGLTGRRLFKGESEADTILAIMQSSVRRPSKVRPASPELFDDIVLKALSRERGERYDTAADLADALDEARAALAEGSPTLRLSQWMQATFPDRKAKSEQLTQLARQLDDPGPASVGDAVDEPVETEPSEPVELPRPWELTRMRAVRVGGIAFIAIAAVGLAGALGYAVGDRPGEVSPQPTSALRAPTRPTAAPRPEPAPPPEARATPTESAEPIREDEEPSAAVAEEPREARRRRRAAPRVTVRVVTPGGWADIFWRGRHVGRTPGAVRLPVGTQTLELRPSGGGPAIRRTVRVERGEARTVVARLDR